MIFKIVTTTFFAFAVLQVVSARLYCDCEVEYAGHDPEFMLTEVRRTVYKEYETVRVELEESDCGSDASSPRCIEQRSLLEDLWDARFALDDFLCELNVSIVSRMRDAYATYGGSANADYARLLNELWSDTETQLKPYLVTFREHLARPRSFMDNMFEGVQSTVKGFLGGISVC
ncbi:uncharacterized protein LOC112690556 [Sipha flava]|uniref:Uncharacterized protein LOC112690556 n=1 Tax=Sipha flava TaxID=143950 RepID=A0A8B8GAY4_9HEMI|nr:uncharacterized protein LOC112690556 [Sipha flava]